MPRLIRAALILACSVVLAGCAGVAVTGAPSAAGAPSGADASEVPAPSAATEPTPTDPAGAGLGAVPTACYGLGEEDCLVVRDHVATLLTAGDPPVRHVQVGSFGCPAVQGCPRTVAARPEGDVTLELVGGALGFHVTMRGGILAAERQGVLGINLPPLSRPPIPAAPQPLTLGHCGLWSGVDLGGSWWDPVGFVDSDHGDSINAAEGTIAVVDADHAVFTSNGGLTVQLVRHAGEKYLPLCD